MKKIILSGFVAILSIIAIWGCSDDSVFSSTQSGRKESVASIFELGKCDQNTDGDSVYVDDQAANYFCDGKSWKIVETDDVDSSESNAKEGGKKYSSSGDKIKSSSSKKTYNNDEDELDDYVYTGRKTKSSSSRSKLDGGAESSSSVNVEVVSSESSLVSSSSSIKSVGVSSSSLASVSNSSASMPESSAESSSSLVKPSSGSSSSVRVVERSSSSAKIVSSSSELAPVSSAENIPSSSSVKKDEKSSSSGKPSSSSASQEPVKVDEIAFELDLAEDCNVFNIGHVVYVQSEDQGYICTESGYEEVAIKKSEGKSSSSKTEPSSSSEQSSNSQSSPSSVSSSASVMDPPVVVIDARDGREYSAVTIGSQIWMAENLNYVSENGNADNKKGSWCYNNQSENCDNLGRLYTWAAAMNITDEYNTESYAESTAKGICPDGFRMPTELDWQTLVDFVASSLYSLDDYGFSFQKSGHYQEIADGGIIEGFDYGLNSTPITGMEFWSSTQESDSKASHWESFSKNSISEKDKLKIHAYSVRCMKDATLPCTESKSGEFIKTNNDIMICKSNGDEFKWLLANTAEQLDYHFGKCSAKLLNDYNERNGYIYICKRSYQGTDDNLVTVYEWEQAQGSDLFGYALEDLDCKDKTVKSTLFLVKQPLLPHVTGKQFYYCEEGEWRVATALEYDTYEQTCNDSLVIKGLQNKNKYYYCEEGTWRNATVVEYDTYNQECITGRIIKGNVNKNNSYYCDKGTWREATVTEIDTYGKECVDKVIVEGNVNTSYSYYCDQGAWRRATTTEIDTYEYECSEGNVVPGRKNTTTYYIYKSGKWQVATTLETDTFGEECSEQRAIQGAVYKDKFYICNGTKWISATKKEADTYLHTCEHNSVVTGNVTKEKYKCVHEKWFGYQCNGDYCSVVLSVSGEQLLAESVELEEETCVNISGTWSNQYYLPTIQFVCQTDAFENPITITYGSTSATYLYNVRLTIGPVVYEKPFSYEGICVSFKSGSSVECSLSN